jgi:hypothetical protein
VVLDKLKTDLQKIFGVKRVTFDMPEDGDSVEQDCLFISVDTGGTRAGEGQLKHKISGTLRIYCENEKAPPGFFAKRIEEADSALTKPFFFYDVEQVTPRYQNISERSARFLYLNLEQYNPSRGEITEVEFEEEEP